jgi:hypothetical protein
MECCEVCVCLWKVQWCAANAMTHLLDIYCVCIRPVLQDELLQEEEGPLVVHLLPQLHLGDPLVGVRRRPGTAVAHVVLQGGFALELSHLC